MSSLDLVVWYLIIVKRVPILANLEKSLIIVLANKDHCSKNPMNIIKVMKPSAKCAGIAATGSISLS